LDSIENQRRKALSSARYKWDEVLDRFLWLWRP
jgi:hypothetical protein